MASLQQVGLNFARQKPLGALIRVGGAPLSALLIGSLFNIWYNSLHVVPLLDPQQHTVFYRTTIIFNGIIYPLLLVLWLGYVRSIMPALANPSPVPAPRLEILRRRVIDLPWVGVGLASAGWIACAIVFPLSLGLTTLDPIVLTHLLTSFAISGSIALTVAFFLLEILTLKLLYPLAFYDARPSEISGARPLTLPLRGLLGALASGAFPILSLLLLILSPHEKSPSHSIFAITVAGAGILSGLIIARLLSSLVVTPIHQLRDASRAVRSGNLDTHIEMLRADELGGVIDEFNRLVGELREKREIEQTFGLHVGRLAAKRILDMRGGPSAQEMDISVLFLDIRGFTKRCDSAAPQTTVAVLNIFLNRMVEVVERHDGLVNKFLGDGLMALFGAISPSISHATEAASCGIALLEALEGVNQELTAQGHAPLRVGIGIHTGAAIVGNVGSSRRMEYTAIGDTVNVAARVQDFTKTVGCPLLLSDATCRKLPQDLAARFPTLGSHSIRGKAHEVALHGYAG